MEFDFDLNLMLQLNFDIYTLCLLAVVLWLSREQVYNKLIPEFS